MSITLLPLANSALLHVKATGCFQVSHKVGLLWGRKGWLLVSYIHFRIPQRHFKTNQKYALWSGLSFINTTVKLLINCNYKAPGHTHTHTLLQTDLHYCASERVAVEGGQSSAEPATHYCTPLYSGWGRRKRGTSVFEWWHSAVYRSEKCLNTGEAALTLACCFWLRPLEGEFLLPWEAAFTAPCLLLCYR